MPRRPIGDEVDQELRRAMDDIASVPGAVPELVDLGVPVVTEKQETQMSKVQRLAIAAAVLLIGAVSALLVMGGDHDVAGDGKIEAGEPSVFDPLATELTHQFVEPEPGAYRVDTLGTPFSLELPESVFIQKNRGTWFAVSALDSARPGDRGLSIYRISQLSDPTPLPIEFGADDEPWPPGDLAGWLDAAPQEIVVTNRNDDTRIGGRPAQSAELRLVSVPQCAAQNRPCAAMATNHFATVFELLPGVPHKVWVVDQGDQDPVLISAAALDPDSDWFTTVDEMLASLAFGEVEENPLDGDTAPWLVGLNSELPAESVDLLALGGISVELPEQSFSVQDQTNVEQLFGLSSDGESTIFVTNPLNDDNEPAAADEIVTLLSTNNDDFVELDSTVVDGIEARVFDLPGSSELGLVLTDAAAEHGWSPPQLGGLARVWLLDHPDRGLLLIASQTPVQAGNEEHFALSEQIISTLEFIDLGS